MPIHTEEQFKDWFYITPEGCWEWTGSITRRGYGQCRYKGTKTRATHRLAYELWVGPLEEGKVIMHTCDNPPCCNPAHLKQGTQKDNMRDAVLKGRKGYKGASNANAKLTEFQVATIHQMHASGVSVSKLAKIFNVSRRQITKIVKGLAWTDMHPSKTTAVPDGNH